MEYAPSFGQWLRQRRTALGLTQAALGECAGCAWETIRKIEADARRPSKELAEHLARCLEIAEEDRTAFVRFARGESSTQFPALLAPQMAHLPELPLAVHTNQPLLSLVVRQAGASVPVNMQAITLHMSERSATHPIDRNRQRLLAKVRTFWIQGVLEQSLPETARITLGLETLPEAFAQPWELLLQQVKQTPRRMLCPETSIVEVFHELGGELLILGAPGAGKTMLLLAIAQSLLPLAEQDPWWPMPVVFNLSSWSIRQGSIATWLVDELNERYAVPRRIGQTWVEEDHVLPLLDGLDEVQQEHRAACVEAINTFRGEHGLVGMVVCSRSDEYAELTDRLKLQGAVLIQPLAWEQINTYLADAGEQLAGLRSTLLEEPALRELAHTPLMLNIMIFAYHGAQRNSLELGATPGEQRRRLFAAYVERMFRRRSADQHYTQEQTVLWLHWLARAMVAQGQSVFLIERLQPDWLPDRATRWQYAFIDRMGSGLVFGLVFGLLAGVISWTSLGQGGGGWRGMPFGLFYGLIVGLFVALFGGDENVRVHERQHMRSILVNSFQGWLVIWGVGTLFGWLIRSVLLFGLVISTLYGPIGALAGALAGRPNVRPRRIIVVEALRWSWLRMVGPALAGGLIAGMLYGLVVSVMFGWSDGLFEGLGVGVIGGLLFALLFGLRAGDIETSVYPNQGIRRSAHRAIQVGSVVGLIGGLSIGVLEKLVFGWDTGLRSGLFRGTLLGLVGGLAYGGYACLSHFALRVVLWRKGYLPWNITRFLDYCAERVFLRKVGGGYIFVHRLLLDYFATLDTSEGALSEQPPVQKDRPTSDQPSFPSRH